jgi:predicted HTH domain antitoxin
VTQVRFELDLPDELAKLLSTTALAELEPARQFRVALVIPLFLAGEISLGKAAELSGEGRPAFEDLLLRLGLPLVRYDLEEYSHDTATIESLERRQKSA